MKKLKSEISKYKPTAKTDPMEMLGNTIPPHSGNAEVAVLGSIINSSSSLLKIIDFIKPEVFYNKDHIIIYRTMLELHRQNIDIELITLTEEMQKDQTLNKVGGSYYLSVLSAKIPTSANIMNYAMYVYERYIKRCLIAYAGKLIIDSYDTKIDVLDQLINAEIDLNGIINLRNIDYMQNHEVESITADKDFKEEYDF